MNWLKRILGIEATEVLKTEIKLRFEIKLCETVLDQYNQIGVMAGELYDTHQRERAALNNVEHLRGLLLEPILGSPFPPVYNSTLINTVSRDDPLWWSTDVQQRRLR